MRWLAACPERPEWLDQDALNEIVGADWLRLGREWNFFHAGDARHFEREDFESAIVVHYAGNKPWNHPDAPASPIYFRHAARAEQKALWRRTANRTPVDRDFIASAYEVLLGRELDSEDVIRDRGGWPATEVLASILDSEEFAGSITRPLKAGEPLSEHLFQHRLSLRHRYWITDRLPVLPQTADAVEQAVDWPEVFRLLIADGRLMSLMGAS